MKNEFTTIYTLQSSRDLNNIRYVGKTISSLNTRLYNHKKQVKDGKMTYVYTWMRKEIREGYKITISELDIVLTKEWEFWEKYWISQVKAWGFKLTNIENGGAYSKGNIKRDLRHANQPTDKQLKYINSIKKPIIVLHKETGKFYKEYNSITECSKDMDLSYNKIQVIASKKIECDKLRTTYRGFRFIYKPEYNPSIDYSIKTTRAPKRA